MRRGNLSGIRLANESLSSSQFVAGYRFASSLGAEYVLKMPTPKAVYSLENAHRFAWSSITGSLHPERVAALQRFVEQGSVLDAGCGGGAYVQYLLDCGLDAKGVELNDVFLAEARKRLPAERLVQADLLQLPFADKSFDTTICFDVLEHIDDRGAIRELARVTRRRLIVALPRESAQLAEFGLAFGTYSDLTHLR